MRVRLFTAIAVFYILAGIVLIPVYSDFDRFLPLDFRQRTIIARNSAGSEPIIDKVSGISLVRVYLDGYVQMLRDYFSFFNNRKIVKLLITLLAIVSGAFIISSRLNRQYRDLYRRAEDLKSGDFTVKLVKSGYFPEMGIRLRELAITLEKEKRTGEDALSAKNAAVMDAVNQLQKTMANMKGNINVLIDSGILTDGSQESVILGSLSESLKEMERAIEPLKKP